MLDDAWLPSLWCSLSSHPHHSGRSRAWVILWLKETGPGDNHKGLPAGWAGHFSFTWEGLPASWHCEVSRGECPWLSSCRVSSYSPSWATCLARSPSAHSWLPLRAWTQVQEEAGFQEEGAKRLSGQTSVVAGQLGWDSKQTPSLCPHASCGFRGSQEVPAKDYCQDGAVAKRAEHIFPGVRDQGQWTASSAQGYK